MAAKKKKILRVGIIGSGDIAKDQHLPYWRQLEAEGRVTVAGVCDVIKERAKTQAGLCENAKVYFDYKKMLAAEDLDVVDVCTQNRFHSICTVAALKAGAHVLVEKPMAMNVKECQAMMKASKAAKKKLMVAQHMRFEARATKMKEVVEAGKLGEIYAAETKWLRRRGIPGWGKFHIKKESQGGPLIDIGVHMMDLAIWLMGCPKPIAASGKVYKMFGDRKDLFNGEWGTPYPAKEFDVEDHATAMIRFEGGITLQMTVSWAANIHDETVGMHILGDRGGVGIEPLGYFSADHSTLTSSTWDYLSDEDGHRAEIRHFTECIEKDKPVMVQPEESLRVQKIIDAIYESSKKNREITIR
jgi:predicted dehydrogenase